MGLMATVVKAFVSVALVAMAACVSAQTHHVVGWAPDSDLGVWLSDRVFTVGDKILFKYTGTDDTIVELQGLEEFLSCNLTNPLRMYTDPVSHVVLEKEGPRYFTSGDPQRCKNGLKLPVDVGPNREFDPDEPTEPDPPSHYEPPPSPHGPYPPVKPTPPYDPPVPERTPPPPYKPPTPSAAAYLSAGSFVLAGGLLMCAYLGM